jgi:hypothetical protein
MWPPNIALEQTAQELAEHMRSKMHWHNDNLDHLMEVLSRQPISRFRLAWSQRALPGSKEFARRPTRWSAS